MGRRKLVRIILESGAADASVTNLQKEKCVDIAVRKGHKEIEEMIRNPPPPVKPPPHVRPAKAESGAEAAEVDNKAGARSKSHKKRDRSKVKGRHSFLSKKCRINKQLTLSRRDIIIITTTSTLRASKAPTAE